MQHDGCIAGHFGKNDALIKTPFHFLMLEIRRARIFGLQSRKGCQQ
jgi:hypothetical protein